MARQVINVGVTPNDGTGDPLRTAYQKCNSNFGELYSRLQDNPPTTPIGNPGDTAGMYAVGTNSALVSYQKFYYCFADYDGSSEIWRVVTGSSF